MDKNNDSFNILKDLLKKAESEINNSEGSDEYKQLIAKKNKLNTMRETLITEIFDSRLNDEKVTQLNKVLQVVDNELKDIDKKTAEMVSVNVFKKFFE